MSPRGGKRSKSNRNQNFKKKHSKFKNKKQVSLKPHHNNVRGKFKTDKRNFEDTRSPNLKNKHVPETEEKATVEESSSSSEEDEDYVKQLLQTFGSNLSEKRTEAIDSSDESMSETEVEDEREVETELAMPDEENEEIHIQIEEAHEDATKNSEDPFVKHLFYEVNDSLLSSVQSTPMQVTNHLVEWPVLGKLQIQIPKCIENTGNLSKFSIGESKQYAPPGEVPTIITNETTLDLCFVKSQIVNNIARANKHLINSNDKLPFTSLQGEIFSIINNYQDLYFAQRTFENAEEIRFIYSLHIINHALKTRSKVLHHNARLGKKEEVPEEFRDQGLVRPKVLVIVPFRDSAYRIISMLIDILIEEDKGNIMNKNRFLEEFTGHKIVMPKKNPKPEDYELLFSGNTGDDFRIGITVTKKGLKLFADFYSADIIIASPLGLRTVIGAEGEPDRDFDFLASIELLILDQTEIFLMQNWDHILHVFNHLHLQPTESHGTDFSRVRTWSLNGWAKYYRQTLIFSSFVLPEVNAIFNKKCCNYAGKIKILNAVPHGSISQVFLQLPHIFQKISCDDVFQSTEARFKFFITKILPQQRETLMKQTLIFVPNYFDYVRLRNYFKREDIGFVQICEYSKEGKVARARDMFFHGDAHFLLYTERYHFFNRARVKGIRHLVFYQPPVFSNFYYEICNLMQEANMNKKVGSMSNMTVTVLYSKYDANQLAGIVGTERAMRMVQSDRNVHLLVTDGR